MFLLYGIWCRLVGLTVILAVTNVVVVREDNATAVEHREDIVDITQDTVVAPVVQQMNRVYARNTVVRDPSVVAQRRKDVLFVRPVNISYKQICLCKHICLFYYVCYYVFHYTAPFHPLALSPP